MPIDFHCPHCGVCTLVDDQHVGQSGRCATCNKPITIHTADTLPPVRERGTAFATTKPSGGSLAVVLVTVGIALLVLVSVTAVVIIAFDRRAGVAGSVRAESDCANQLKQLGLAMHAYHTDHGCFPPALIADAQGKPIHSWRVLLLPYLGEHDLYQEYDFGQPWDSPQNIWAANTMPAVFGCPADEDAAPNETSYQLVVGDGLLFNRTRCSGIAEITDRLDATIMIVETSGAGVMWTEPRDLEAAQISFAINSGLPGEIGSRHVRGGAHLLMADGVVNLVDQMMTPAELRAMATIAGGEIVAPRVVAR